MIDMSSEKAEKSSDETSNPGSLFTLKSVFRNGTILLVTGMLLTTGMVPNTHLQSSINVERGLGTKTMSVGRAVSILTFLLLPTYFIQKFGLKITLTVSSCFVSLSYLTNYYPTWYSLLIGNVMQGLGFGLAVICVKTCIAGLTEQYDTLRGREVASSNSTAFAIFYTANSLASAFGNLISYEILHKSSTYSTKNVTSDSHCGFGFCPGDYKSNKNFIRPDDMKIYILFGFFCASGVLASLIGLALFVDARIIQTNKHHGGGFSYFMQTMRMYKDKYLLLLVPLGLFRGLAAAFKEIEFNRAYTTCTLGEEYIGLLSVSQAFSHAFFSISFGLLVKYTGRPLLCTIAGVNTTALIFVLIFWKPTVTDFPVFFVISSLWVLSRAIWETQVAVLYITLFPTKISSALSNLMLAEAIGNMIGYAYSEFLCVRIKVFVVLGSLLIAYSCYIYVEVQGHKVKEEKVVIESVMVPEKITKKVRFAIASNNNNISFNAYPFEISL